MTDYHPKYFRPSYDEMLVARIKTGEGMAQIRERLTKEAMLSELKTCNRNSSSIDLIVAVLIEMLQKDPGSEREVQ